jgi:hypothetical protein
MAALWVDPDRVYSYIPAEIKRHVNVVADGQGGITSDTYDVFVNDVEDEIQTRLLGIDITTLTSTYTQAQKDLVDRTLITASSLLVAAKICRRLKSYTEISNSLFADANIKLRLVFEKLLGVGGENQQAPEFVENTGAVLITDLSVIAGPSVFKFS